MERAVGAVYDLVNGNSDSNSDLKGTKGTDHGSEETPDIVTYGPIIHNEVVVEDLRRRGVGVINTRGEITSHQNGTIVIRSHGVSRDLYDTIVNSGAKVVDTTCTFVKRIHDIVAAASDAGRQIVIVGNHGHAEVEGHIGWCMAGNDTAVFVVETPKEAEEVPLALSVPVTVVAQTTFNGERFDELVDILRQRRFQLEVHNTICNATRERQEEAGRIAANVDVMLVIGSKSSSNTAKLYDICSRACPHTYLIQTVHDLRAIRTAGTPDASILQNRPQTIGITAGASTPKYIIEEVQSYVRGTDI